MNSVLGVMSIIGGGLLIVRIWLKPHGKSSWLLNTRGMLFGVLLVLLGIMLIAGY